MLHLSLVNKLTKAGLKVESDGRKFQVLSKNGRNVLEWHTQNYNNKIEVVCLKFRSVNDHNDCMTDYRAGFYVDSIKWALELSNRD